MGSSLRGALKERTKHAHFVYLAQTGPIIRVSFCLPWDWWLCFSRSFKKSLRKGNDSDIPWELTRVTCYHCCFEEGFPLTVSGSSTPTNRRRSAPNSAFQKTFSVLGFWASSKVSPTVTASQKAPRLGVTSCQGVLAARQRHHRVCPSDQSCQTMAPVTEGCKDIGNALPFKDKTRC